MSLFPYLFNIFFYIHFKTTLFIMSQNQVFLLLFLFKFPWVLPGSLTWPVDVRISLPIPLERLLRFSVGESQQKNCCFRSFEGTDTLTLSLLTKNICFSFDLGLVWFLSVIVCNYQCTVFLLYQKPDILGD